MSASRPPVIVKRTPSTASALCPACGQPVGRSFSKHLGWHPECGTYLASRKRSRRSPSAAVALDFEAQSCDAGEGAAPSGGAAEHDVERQFRSARLETNLQDEEMDTIDDEVPLAGEIDVRCAG